MTDIKADIDALPGLDPRAPLLEVNDLHVEFRTRDGVAKEVNRVEPRVCVASAGAVITAMSDLLSSQRS